VVQSPSEIAGDAVPAKMDPLMPGFKLNHVAIVAENSLVIAELSAQTHSESTGTRLGRWLVGGDGCLV
jgi:hypothetical protein